MNDILSEIASNKRREINSRFSSLSERKAYKELVEREFPVVGHPSMMGAISNCAGNGKPGIIAEFKRRSPSKRDIAPMADIVPVVTDYSVSGAAACSVLTDTRFFGGSLADLSLARKSTTLPLLRKDFIIDEIQIFEALHHGADAILLIASILSVGQIEDFTLLAHSLGLEVLFEIHEIGELSKMSAQVDMVGVNNRRLSTFDTDTNHAATVARSLPSDKVLIAESGIKDKVDINRLMKCGFQGFLIGETLMRSRDRSSCLSNLIGHGS